MEVKYQTKYQVGQTVLYNSLLCAGAAKGTIRMVNNEKIPHIYTIEPDLFKGKTDTVEEYHIIQKL